MDWKIKTYTPAGVVVVVVIVKVTKSETGGKDSILSP